MLLTPGTISRGVRVGKFVGAGFLNLVTARGEVKAFSGDHVVEIDYPRAPRAGEPGFGNPKAAPIVKTVKFVVPEDAARALGIFLPESVEVMAEMALKALEDKKIADAEAAAAAQNPPANP